MKNEIEKYRGSGLSREQLQKDIDEVRGLTDNPDYIDSLNMCEESLDNRIHWQSIHQIVKTIRILIRKNK